MARPSAALFRPAMHAHRAFAILPLRCAGDGAGVTLRDAMQSKAIASTFWPCRARAEGIRHNVLVSAAPPLSAALWQTVVGAVVACRRHGATTER
eukprot:NODE_20521_length_794_cov_2.800600.p3 GENE.NODE_20521_length_794_cov_2.800600~~NODE_20521_length_794_cov_2.800600.p3  ORF type:complete len:95 (-),score=12.08 NODE_20521_length_794_cov_2.800600:375-659(-)